MDFLSFGKLFKNEKMYIAIKMRKNLKKIFWGPKTLKTLNIYSFYRFRKDYRCVLFYYVLSKNRLSSFEHFLENLIDNSPNFSGKKNGLKWMIY